MSDWTWEYDPSADEVVGGLPEELVQQVAALAQRLADAAGVRHLGDPAVEDSGVSGIRTMAERPWLVWYLEHRRRRIVYIVRVQHWPGTG